MENLININNATADSPRTSLKWKNKTEKERVSEIETKLYASLKNNNFEVFNAYEDGQVVLKTTKSIPAKERGVELLEIEEMLKKSIDDGITVWLEPVGDKSKLRNLRGITIKTIE